MVKINNNKNKVCLTVKNKNSKISVKNRVYNNKIINNIINASLMGKYIL